MQKWFFALTPVAGLLIVGYSAACRDRALNILPFDLAGELFDEFLNIRRERINRERLFENLQGAFVETGPLQNHAHAGESAKLARFQFDDLVESGHRGIRVTGEEPRCRPLIPDFSPIG